MADVVQQTGGLGCQHQPAPLIAREAQLLVVQQQGSGQLLGRRADAQRVRETHSVGARIDVKAHPELVDEIEPLHPGRLDQLSVISSSTMMPWTMSVMVIGLLYTRSMVVPWGQDSRLETFQFRRRPRT